MPELPEVERGRKLAERVARGRAVVKVWCAKDTIVFQGLGAATFRHALETKKVLAVCRRGKQLWFQLDRPPHPLFHFGMTGAFRIPSTGSLQLKSGPKENDAHWPPRFVKICLFFDNGGELVMTDARRLGRILLRDDPMNEPPINELGFDPLLALPGPKAFVKVLRKRSAVIKSLLLNQRFAAGVGNWIADEVLYQAGIDPRRRADSLSDHEARLLRRKLKSVIETAVAANAEDERYPRTWLFHRRWRKRCDATTVHGEPIEHITIAGRTTAWVPAVQS
ncbi:MAG: Fpg/Nei family DNA glycosylase [Acidiferrobacterales bacterium]